MGSALTRRRGVIKTGLPGTRVCKNTVHSLWCESSLYISACMLRDGNDIKARCATCVHVFPRQFRSRASHLVAVSRVHRLLAGGCGDMLAIVEPSSLCTALSSRSRPCRGTAEDASSGARAIAHQMQTAPRIAFWHGAVARATMWSRIWADSRMLELGVPNHASSLRVVYASLSTACFVCR